jgi:hypothetical protein
VVEDLADDDRIFDAGDDVHGCTNAASAGCARAVILTAPAQARQVSMSMLNTRCT